MDAGRLARITLGFMLAPAIGLCLLGVSWCAIWALNPSGSFQSCFADGSIVALVVGLGAVFAYPAALVFGLPLFVIFWRRRWLRSWQVSLAGIAVAALAVAAAALYGGSLSGALGYLLLTASVGFASAIAFWVIAIRTPSP